MHGGGAHYKVAVPQVFSIVADRDLNPQRAQVLNGITLTHIGALHRKSHALQNLCQRAHGNAADAHQVDALSGNQIITDGIRIIHHRNILPFQNAAAGIPAEKRCIFQ